MRLSILLDDHYQFLASSVAKYLGNGDFWKHQKIGLQELGIRFNPAKLCRVVLMRWLKFLLKPKQVIKKILTIRIHGRWHIRSKLHIMTRRKVVQLRDIPILAATSWFESNPPHKYAAAFCGPKVTAF